MQQNNVFSRRLFVISFVKVFLILIVVVRLFFLQVKKQSYFDKLADKNRINYIPIIPKRGIIFDRFNTPIASNKLVWLLFVIKSQIKSSIEDFLNSLTIAIKLTEEETERIIKDYNSNSSYSIILLKSDLSQTEIATIETYNNMFNGVFISNSYQRSYPFKNTISNILGYVALPDDIKRTANWLTGKTGVELSLESILKGEIGYQRYEIDARGRIIKQLAVTPETIGNNAALTIDNYLQSAIYDYLMSHNYTGSAVVLDIETGDVLSMVSTPSYDPNMLISGISKNDWEGLTKDIRAPLLNKPISSLYPPASTMKPLIALEALNDNIISPNTEFTCKGTLKVGKDEFHCYKKEGHGKLKLEQAIIHSCDIYFYQVALELRKAQLQNIAKNFSLNKKLLPFLSGERSGNLPLSGYSHTVGDIIVSSIGQGTWTVTPLELAYMIGLIGNGGNKIELKILKNIEYKNKLIYSKPHFLEGTLPYAPEHIKFIQNALYKTVNLPYGTGGAARTGIRNWSIAGKTGTAQVHHISAKDRENSNINNKIWQLRDHSVFVGYLPYENPKYAISVVLEHEGFAAGSAAPLGKFIGVELEKRHQLYEDQKINFKKLEEGLK